MDATNANEVLDALPDDLITTTRAGTIAKVHPSGVRRWVTDGRIRGWTRAGRLFVSEGEVRGLFRPVKSRAERRAERGVARASQAAFDRRCERVLREAGMMK